MLTETEKHVRFLCDTCGPLQVAELTLAAEKHAAVVEENRRLYNEVLDLKGNIRVFCRLRPAGATGDGSQRESHV